MALYHSSWDVVSVWRNRESHSEDIEIDWEKRFFYLLFRKEVSVYMLEVTEKQFDLLRFMQNGDELAKALDTIDIGAGELQELFSMLKAQNVPIVQWND